MLPRGGTELLLEGLAERLDSSLLEQVQIVSRPVNIDDSRKTILWVHDLPADMPFLADSSSRLQFDGIVFVSSWQQQVFNINAGVPYSGSTIIRNAIEPIEVDKKPDDGIIRLIYHPTPHRGLEILVPVFVELAKKYNNIHLDVFSNFDIYARPELNTKYEKLYDICRSHDQITYHGTQPNSVVRDFLAKSHIFAYPSIWRETSCLCAMEAMSAKCAIIAPNYGALPETLANFGLAYDFNENHQVHSQMFASALESTILTVNDEHISRLLDLQKLYADSFYSWESRIPQWEIYIKHITESRSNRRPRGKLIWN